MSRRTSTTSTTHIDLDAILPRGPRAAHAAVRHGAGRSGGRRAVARCAPSSGSSRPIRFGIPALAHEECLAGLRRLGCHRLPGAAQLGRELRPRRSSREMGGRIGADMRSRRRAPGPRARARRRARRALGPRRGDDRRGPVPRRHRRHRVRPGRWSRPGSSRRSSTSSATRRRRAGATSPRSRSARASSPTCCCRRSRWRSARAARASVMNSYTDIDGIPTAADREPADRAAARRVGFRGHRRRRLLRDRVPQAAARRQRGLDRRRRATP